MLTFSFKIKTLKIIFSGGVVLAHYPLNHHPARAAAEDLYRSITKRRPTAVGSALGSAAFVAMSASVAVAVPDLGSVLHLIGGTAAAFIIFFLPGLLLINAAIVKKTAAESASFADLQALVDGGAAALASDGGNENGATEASSASQRQRRRRREAARRARREAVAASKSGGGTSASATRQQQPSLVSRTPPATATAATDNSVVAGAEYAGVGIKKTGLVFSPAKSWWLGVSLVGLAVFIWTITIVTAVFPYRE